MMNYKKGSIVISKADRVFKIVNISKDLIDLQEIGFGKEYDVSFRPEYFNTHFRLADFVKGDRIVSKEPHEYKGKKYHVYYRITNIQPRCKVHWIHETDKDGNNIGAFGFLDIDDIYRFFKKWE